jgi:squalene synthase HpnC
MVNAPSYATAPAVSLAASRAYCHRLAREHYENFTVLSWLTPHPLRPHRAVLYAYCRTIDDLGDEARGDRPALLDRFEEELDRAAAGRGRGELFTAVSDTMARFDLPREPFAQLIEANRIDQRRSRYETFDELVDYCEHSANPVGRLVLMMHGYRDAERFALSDATCTALQLANFWQDLARDRAASRIYLPRADMSAFGVTEADLAASEACDRLCALVRFEVDRTRDLFLRGLPLVDRVGGRLKVELALFSRGGLAILKAIRAQDYDTLRARPALSSGYKRRLIASTLFGLAAGRRRWT